MTLLLALCLSLVWPCIVVTVGFVWLRRAWQLPMDEPLFSCWFCIQRKRRHQMLPGNTHVCKLCAMDDFVWRVQE